MGRAYDEIRKHGTSLYRWLIIPCNQFQKTWMRKVEAWLQESERLWAFKSHINGDFATFGLWKKLELRSLVVPVAPHGLAFTTETRIVRNNKYGDDDFYHSNFWAFWAKVNKNVLSNKSGPEFTNVAGKLNSITPQDRPFTQKIQIQAKRS